MRHLPLLLAILFIAVPTSAASAGEVSARQFVDLLRYEDQFIKYRETCIATQRTVSPSALVAQNPNYFGGIRPGHKQWQVIVTAYEAYFQEACSRPTKTEFLESLSVSYAKVLSEQQLKEAIAFYSSNTGQALVSAHTFATTALYQTWTDINGKHLTKAAARFQAELARLIEAR
ncbi:MAG: DUF2059 domain-containing protein [Acidovorax sp.]|nr:DUF2059 domain-containing protein [Acidovorax sp.]